MMKIASFVSGLYTIPPPTGTIFAPMDIASMIATSMAKRGHDVTVYAPAKSRIPNVKVINHDLEPLKQNRQSIYYENSISDVSKGIIETIWDQYLIAKMILDSGEVNFDIFHLHTCHQSFPLALSHPHIPFIYTVHDSIKPWRRDLFSMYYSPNQLFVSISDAQRKVIPSLQFIATIYNGINLNDFPFSDQSQSFLLNAGRIMSRKGVKEAIDIAMKVKKKLVIIGPHDEEKYWEEKIKPKLNRSIKYYSYKPRKKLYNDYQNAKAFLFPIQWDEPFGLVMIEAMACGTPVVAFRRGSVPEVVKDGETGFICPPGDMKCMVQAVKRIYDMPEEKYKQMRRACREHVERNFTVEKMVDGYERVYERVIHDWKKKRIRK